MKSLAWLDAALFIPLTFFLFLIAVTSGITNIQTDAIDYYAIVQRLVKDTPPILPDLPFIAQRSPGYPLLTLPVYAALRLAPEGQIEPALSPRAGQENQFSSEQVFLPPHPLRLNEIFFRNFNLGGEAGIFRWQIITAMLFTSYGLFFSGLFAIAHLLVRLYHPLPGYSLTPLTVMTSTVFLHNWVQTPSYATLTAFGVACWVVYAWLLAWKTKTAWAQAASGAAIGMLVLVRLETIVLVAVGFVSIWCMRQWQFLGWFIAGGLIPLALLITYNSLLFGNPFHAGILRGNLNILVLEPKYVLAGLVGLKSGLLWHSMLIMAGLAGLLTSRQVHLQTLGWAGAALVGLVLLRVPVMYFCIGQGTQVVEGVLISCPPNWEAFLQLIRWDVNRYVIPLAPFAVLGLREMIHLPSQMRETKV
ncbi:MAG: hypothetical protein NZP74_02755 [Anaerolineales bacterium]|nr:hypothetical protein [Anaerolineales bacterium]MDW8279302.1 hypothetical protein [Anaerolineales bacterium]